MEATVSSGLALWSSSPTAGSAISRLASSRRARPAHPRSTCHAWPASYAEIDWREATPTDFFDWLEWQSQPRRRRSASASCPGPEGAHGRGGDESAHRGRSGPVVAVFLADLGAHRDRAIMLLMLLGGLRSAECRSLRLAISTSACGR